MLLLVAAGIAIMSTIAHAQASKRHTAEKVDVALASFAPATSKVAVTKAHVCINVCQKTGVCLDKNQ